MNAIEQAKAFAAHTDDAIAKTHIETLLEALNQPCGMCGGNGFVSHPFDEAKDGFCQDEGCPHYGIAHICVSTQTMGAIPQQETKRIEVEIRHGCSQHGQQLRDCSERIRNQRTEIKNLRSRLDKQTVGLENENAAFEQWAKWEGYNLRSLVKGRYTSGDTQIAWDAWKKRAKLTDELNSEE